MGIIEGEYGPQLMQLLLTTHWLQSKQRIVRLRYSAFLCIFVFSVNLKINTDSLVFITESACVLFEVRPEFFLSTI